MFEAETDFRIVVEGFFASLVDVFGLEGDSFVAVRAWELDPAVPPAVGPVGAPLTLGGGGRIIAIVIDDFDGNGRSDVLGVIPDDPAPIRLWLGNNEDGVGEIGAEIRFEMPPVIECTSIRLPGEDAARLAVVERASKRIVVYEIAAEQIAESGNRDAAILVRGFNDAGNRKRDHAVADVDGDGRLDLVVTDTEANALVLYRQRAGKGLRSG